MDRKERVTRILEENNIQPGFVEFSNIDLQKLSKSDIHQLVNASAVLIIDKVSGIKETFMLSNSIIKNTSIRFFDINKSCFLKNCLIDDVVFSQVNIRNAVFLNCKFINVVFSQCNFEEGFFIGCKFINCQMKKVKLNKTTWFKSNFKDIDINNDKTSIDFCECEDIYVDEPLEDLKSDKSKITEKEKETGMNEEIIEEKIFSNMVMKTDKLKNKIFNKCTFDNITFDDTVIEFSTSFIACTFLKCTFDNAKCNYTVFDESIFKNTVFNGTVIRASFINTVFENCTAPEGMFMKCNFYRSTLNDSFENDMSNFKLCNLRKDDTSEVDLKKESNLNFDYKGIVEQMAQLLNINLEEKMDPKIKAVKYLTSLNDQDFITFFGEITQARINKNFVNDNASNANIKDEKTNIKPI